ncbi:MAG: hydrogenase expression/formation protein HypE [Planctomycetota bacterium]
MTANWTCPIPAASLPDRITLAHGEGARLTRQLLQHFILPRLNGIGEGSHRPHAVAASPAPLLQDAAEISTAGGMLAFCTDAHTITPLHFPGGNLGSLAVFGTVNDLAVAGAVPRWMSLALILEEGLPTAELGLLLDSAAAAARYCGVHIVAGDTKVVPVGAADRIFMITSGVGELHSPPPPGPASIQEGDCLILSGDIGRHGVAVLAARGQLQSDIRSDCGSLIPAATALRTAAGNELRCMRDCTRGGVAAVLHEWALETPLAFELDDARIPVSPAVRGAAELLGLDPLHLPNEGTLVAVVSALAAPAALQALRSLTASADATLVGNVCRRRVSPVLIQRGFGRPGPLDEPAGAPLPRIC